MIHDMHMIKVVVVGESGVGKSSLSQYYSTGIKTCDEHNPNPTIGIELYTKKVNKNNKKIKMYIWDTAGQERYKSITKQYYRNANIAIICYSIIKRGTFKKLEYYIDELEENTKGDLIKVLVGTFKDKSENREVSKEDGEEKARSMGAKYYEISSTTGENINELFEYLLEEGEKRIDNGEIYEVKQILEEGEEINKGCC